jgi:large subunit ribosomal protein L9
MPEAVLLQDVASLGERGSVVEVSKGYLRNYLVPRKLAAQATPGMLDELKRREEAAVKAQAEAAERAADNAAMLNRTVLTIPRQAGPDGRLFGSITPKDIADAIYAARTVKIDRHGVHLPEPIRNVGTYMVVVELPRGHTATVKTMVVAAEPK